MGLIYLDASAAIFAVEETASEAQYLRSTLEQPTIHRFAISPLVKLECLIRPLRTRNISLQHYYEEWLIQFRNLPIDESVFESATHIRSRFHLKTPDALHLGGCLMHGCSGIWTFDQRLASTARQLGLKDLL